MPPSNVVVLNYKFWQRRYDSDPNVVGQILQLDHQNYTIVGIMPKRFSVTETVGNADVYIPWTEARISFLFSVDQAQTRRERFNRKRRVLWSASSRSQRKNRC